MISPLHRLTHRPAQLWRHRGTLLKAASFASIGVINALIDASVFFLAYATFGTVAPLAAILQRIAAWCDCGGEPAIRLVAANVVAWLVAVSGSYVMNTFITFAAESGRRLAWGRYFTFVVSGMVGLLANTAVLLLAAQALPVWTAKGLAILASFVVNFSLSHFVVFRPGKQP